MAGPTSTITAADDRTIDGAQRARAIALRSTGLLVALAVLAGVAVLSIAVGSQPIELGTVWSVLWHDDGSREAVIVNDQRVPRTLAALLVGGALGVAGAVMQGLTRNPLADPGLLGIDFGGTAAVVSAVAFLGVTTAAGYVWFAFAGTAAASVVVYVLGTAGRAATPDRLVLAGAAIGAVLAAYINAMILLEPSTFDAFRFWNVGSVRGRELPDVLALAPFIAVGTVLALALARPLNAMALGEDTGRALGARVGHARAAGAVAIVLLCGGATAMAGPLFFVGLVVAHGVRLALGPDHRWLLPYALVVGAILVVLSDLLGRVVVAPGELQVGVVTAFLGSPVFILLCRRRRITQL